MRTARLLLTGLAMAACGRVVDLGPERVRVEDAGTDLGNAGNTGNGGTGGSAGAAGSGSSGGSAGGGGSGGEASAGSGGAGGSAGTATDGGDADPEAGDAGEQCTSGPVLWAKRFGAVGAEVARGAAADGQGGLFYSGYFSGALDLGDGPMLSAGGSDLFLARFDANGKCLWSQRFGGVFDEYGEPTSLSRAPDGGVVFGGTYQGTIDFGKGASTSSGLDGFVARYDASGTPIWTRTLGGSGHTRLQSVAVDASGAVFIAGFFLGAMLDIFGSQKVAASQDAFVAKLDANGTPLWSKQLTSTGKTSINAVAVAANGNIVVGGSMSGSLDVGLGPILNANTSGTTGDAWVGIFDSSGAAIWADAFGDTATQDLARIAVDPVTNDIVVAGLLTGSIDFGGGPVSSSFGTYLGRLSSTGGHVSSRAVSSLLTRDLVVDGSGTVLLAGVFSDIIDFGAGGVASEGAEDGVAAGLGSGFSQSWMVPFGSLQPDNADGVAVGTDLKAFVIGTFRSTITLPGCKPLTSAGDTDLLLTKLAP